MDPSKTTKPRRRKKSELALTLDAVYAASQADNPKRVKLDLPVPTEDLEYDPYKGYTSPYWRNTKRR